MTPRLIITFGLAAAVSSGCGGYVVRDASTYQSMNQLMSRYAADSSTALNQWIHDNCTCSVQDSKLRFDKQFCTDSATTALVGSFRMPWHLKMELFLAGMGQDPGEPPPNPDLVSLCPKVTK